MPTVADYSTTTAPLFIQYAAIRHGVNYEELKNTLYCESHFVASAVGDGGTSFGVSQVHLPAHLDVTKEQALDPLWSIEFAAQQFALGNAKIWTCWRTLYGNRSG